MESNKSTGSNDGRLPVKKSWLRRNLPDEKPITELVLFAILCVVVFLAVHYIPKQKSTLKSARIAGVNIVSQSQTEANKTLAKAAAAQKINIVIKDKTYTYSDSDLGIKRDASAILDSTYAPPRSLINKWTSKNQTASLKTYVQKKRLLGAIDDKLGDLKTIQNASVGVNGADLVVNPGRPGINIDYDQIIKQIEGSDLRAALTITASFSLQDPQILTSAAQDAKNQAAALISPAYGVKSDSKGSKFATAAQKNGWLVFTPDQSTHKINVAINVVAARATMSSLAQSFTKSAASRVTLTSTDGSSVTLDDGQAGVAVDQASLNSSLNQFSDAVIAQQAYTLPVSLAVKPQGERNLGTSTGGKFVLVDVAAYKAYAINNTSVDRTMVVSTGRPGLETPKGHFNILSKTKLVTMSGCNTLVGCWTVPNVPNAEFFTKDGDALHGTYWYVNWGHQNASHGCVNLHLDDASWLFDWTAVGTDVVVV